MLGSRLLKTNGLRGRFSSLDAVVVVVLMVVVVVVVGLVVEEELVVTVKGDSSYGL